MIKHLNIKIHGLVQGVYFRVSAKEEAEKINILGFAENKPDGSVYIEAEGEEKDLDQFINWCKDGPSSAKVEKIEVTPGELKDFTEFGRDFADY